MWKWGLEATASRALVRMPWAVGVWTGDASGFAVVRYGEIRPRRRGPTGKPPGAYGANVAVLQSLPAATSASRPISLSLS